MIMLLLGVTTLGVVTLICSAKSNGNKLNLGYIDAADHLYSMQTRKFMDPRTCSTKNCIEIQENMHANAK